MISFPLFAHQIYTCITALPPLPVFRVSCGVMPWGRQGGPGIWPQGKKGPIRSRGFLACAPRRCPVWSRQVQVESGESPVLLLPCPALPGPGRSAEARNRTPEWAGHRVHLSAGARRRSTTPFGLRALGQTEKHVQTFSHIPTFLSLCPLPSTPYSPFPYRYNLTSNPPTPILSLATLPFPSLTSFFLSLSHHHHVFWLRWLPGWREEKREASSLSATEDHLHYSILRHSPPGKISFSVPPRLTLVIAVGRFFRFFGPSHISSVVGSSIVPALFARSPRLRFLFVPVTLFHS